LALVEEVVEGGAAAPDLTDPVVRLLPTILGLSVADGGFLVVVAGLPTFSPLSRVATLYLLAGGVTMGGSVNLGAEDSGALLTTCGLSSVALYAAGPGEEVDC